MSGVDGLFFEWNQISEGLRINDAKKRFEELNQRLESDIIEILKYHQGIITEIMWYSSIQGQDNSTITCKTMDGTQFSEDPI